MTELQAENEQLKKVTDEYLTELEKRPSVCLAMTLTGYNKTVPVVGDLYAQEVIDPVAMRYPLVGPFVNRRNNPYRPIW